MTPYGMSRKGVVGGGIFLLLYEVLGTHGLHLIPKITLLSVAFMTGIHLRLLSSLFSLVTLCPIDVLNGSFSGLLLGPLFHGDDIHLYYNMASLLWKGRKLEPSYGPLNFTLLLVFLTLGTSLTYVGLSYLVADFFMDPSYLHVRAIGFSGVLFALKVIAGERNPISLGTWAELILIQLAVPNASFLGHLGGLLFGIIYVYNPFSSLIRSARKSLSKFHLLALGITILGLHIDNSGHSSYEWLSSIKDIFSSSSSRQMCIDSRIRYWSYFLTAPLRYRDSMDYLLLFISIPIKLSLLESYRGSIKAWLSAIGAFLGTPVAYYLCCHYLRLEKIPYLSEECVYGLSGPLFALKAACLCVMLFGGMDFPTLAFELLEALFFLNIGDDSYNLYHLSGLAVGILIYVFLRSQRKYVFGGTGHRLGQRDREPSSSSSSSCSTRSSRATRSWGYGDYDRDSVVRRRRKGDTHKNEFYIDPLILEESFESEEDEETHIRIKAPSPSAPPPEPSYPSSNNPPPPPPLAFHSFKSRMNMSHPPPSAPSEEAMDVDEEYPPQNSQNEAHTEVREKKINKFG